MDTSPAILRMHPELDGDQRAVVAHTKGPLLVIAGPGSGKTLCLQLRAVNLLLSGGTVPEELVLCTFGRDAALELQRRFRASAAACGLAADLSRVSVSTIHGLCHRILTTYPEIAGLRPGYRLLNESEQHLLLHERFDAVLGPERDILAGRGWRDGVQAVAGAARYFDRVCDELIDPLGLARSARPLIAAMGRSLQRYRQLLRDRNIVDFAHLQVWAHRVMQDKGVVAAVGGAIRHLMVDEFQDTSRVQMLILQRLAGAHDNIAVVGDDDQSIYRFRGARVANMPEFPNMFPGCRVLGLTTNYRSHRGIVAACGQWMDNAADWSDPKGAGRSFRYPKDIVSHAPDAHADYPAVISVQGRGPIDEAGQISDLLRFLVHNGVIGSYGQAALLLHSVKDRVSGPYLDGLERAGIPVRCEPAGHVRVPAGDEVLVTTIHQAKGREWDVVIVGSLGGPNMATDRIGRNLADCGVYSGDPENLIGDFDRARQHYVALTRARRLLVLTACGDPQARFNSIWERADRWPGVDREALARQRFGDAGRVPGLTVVIDHLDRLVIKLAPPR